jgi:CelD/BcsL family acetyltransferase involved in cellulose biosynthesis
MLSGTAQHADGAGAQCPWHRFQGLSLCHRQYAYTILQRRSKGHYRDAAERSANRWRIRNDEQTFFAMTSWSVMRYEGMEGLLELEPAWRRLCARIGQRGFHHAFETHVAYMQHARAQYGPSICLAVSDGTSIRAICPIEAGVARLYRRESPAWVLPFGLGNVVRDVICPPDDEEASRALLPAVARHLAKQPGGTRWLVLDRITETSCAYNAVQHLAPGLRSIDTSAHLDVLNTEGTHAALSARLSRKFRSNLRSARTKLDAMPGVEFVNYNTPTEVAAAFDAFLDLEGSGWKGASGSSSSLRHKPEVQAFFQSLIGSLAGGDRCEMNVLYADGRCIAALFCIRYGSEYAIVKTAYDETLARVAPGRLLMDWTIARCCEDPRVSRVNFVSHQGWLKSWQPDVLPVRTAYISLHPYAARAHVAVLNMRFRLGPPLKKLLNAVATRFRRTRPGGE